MSGTSYLLAREVFHIAHRGAHPFRESKELEKWSFIYSWRLCLRGEVRTMSMVFGRAHDTLAFGFYGIPGICEACPTRPRSSPSVQDNPWSWTALRVAAAPALSVSSSSRAHSCASIVHIRIRCTWQIVYLSSQIISRTRYFRQSYGLRRASTTTRARFPGSSSRR